MTELKFLNELFLQFTNASCAVSGDVKMPSGEQWQSESLSVKKLALRDECCLMGLLRVACTTRRASVNHALFSRSLSDQCLAHARAREAAQTLMGLIQHWLTSPIQHRHPFLAFCFFLPLEQISSRHLAEWVTCPSYTRNIICSMRHLLISSHLLWTHAHTHIHIFPCWKDQCRWLPAFIVFWMQDTTIVLQFPPGFLTSLASKTLRSACFKQKDHTGRQHYYSHI